MNIGKTRDLPLPETVDMKRGSSNRKCVLCWRLKSPNKFILLLLISKYAQKLNGEAELSFIYFSVLENLVHQKVQDKIP